MTMSTQFNPGGSITGWVNSPAAPISLGHKIALPIQEPLLGHESTSRPADGALVPRTCLFAPFDEHSRELVEAPRWKEELDGYFMNVFKISVLAGCPIDILAVRAVQIVGSLTQVKMRGLALAVYVHWMRMQYRFKDASASAPKIITLILRMADCLGWMSVHAKKDFLDEFNCLCVEKLKLTWRWYVAAVIHKALPIPRESLFMRVMAVVRIIGHLYRGGQLQHGAALDGLRHIAVMSPWPDAVAIIYALLYELGPEFALEQTGWQFIQQAQANLFLLTAARPYGDPLRQLCCAINTLVTEWQRTTRVTLYDTYPKENIHFHARHSQT